MDGHLTDVPVSRACSTLVSLKHVALVLFLVEVNGLELWEQT